MHIVRVLIRGCAAPALRNYAAVGSIFGRACQQPRDCVDCDLVMDPSPRWTISTMRYNVANIELIASGVSEDN